MSKIEKRVEESGDAEEQRTDESDHGQNGQRAPGEQRERGAGRRHEVAKHRQPLQKEEEGHHRQDVRADALRHPGGQRREAADDEAEQQPLRQRESPEMKSRRRRETAARRELPPCWETSEQYEADDEDHR